MTPENNRPGSEPEAAADPDAGPASVPTGAAGTGGAAPAGDPDAGPGSAPGPAQGGTAEAVSQPAAPELGDRDDESSDDALDGSFQSFLFQNYGKQLAMGALALVATAVVIRRVRRR